MAHQQRLLRWIYFGRLTLAAGIFGGVLLVWPLTAPETTRLATLVLLLSLAVTVPSAWHTHVRRRVPGRTFLYGQVLFDILLVTAAVHLTGGGESDFAPLYILVIATGALLLPLAGGMLVGVAAIVFYLGDILLLHPGSPPETLVVQLGLFGGMVLLTGYLGDRLRQTGVALGEAESELRQLRLDTGDILGTLDTGVVTVDENGRLMYLNPAAELLLRLRGRDWLARPFLDELERRAAGLGRIARRTAARGVTVRRHEAVFREDGVERVLGARTTLLERAGAPWVTVVFQDITDGKRVEALDRQALRLQAVAELAASLAHEIKNPLASIRSAVEQLGNGRLGSADRDVLQGLVVRESDRLSRLLSEFIEFSRVELRQPRELDLRAVVDAAVDLARRHPDAAPGTLIEWAPPADPVPATGDADLLHRAIFNLLLNGVQHAPPDGRVRVELRAVPPGGLPAGINLIDPVLLRVSDDGPGIDPGDLPRLFDPFFTNRRGGTGLGLALVHRAVEAHAGAILVGGAPGAGAEFSVYLPARRPTEDGSS
jgi:two-component system, NtrC family, sensor histidine kinase PilS